MQPENFAGLNVLFEDFPYESVHPSMFYLHGEENKNVLYLTTTPNN